MSDVVNRAVANILWSLLCQYAACQKRHEPEANYARTRTVPYSANDTKKTWQTASRRMKAIGLELERIKRYKMHCPSFPLCLRD